MKILIIDDDEKVVEFIRDRLVNDTYDVETALDGTTGSYMARTNHYDLIIIDCSLPDKNGVTVCKEIRVFGSNAWIVFLSMNHSIHNKVQCFEAGADDYITKPFAFEELSARIKALAKRPKKIEDTMLFSGDIILDITNNKVYKDGICIYLTKTEYNLLEYMLRNKGKVLSRTMIMEHVWNASADPLSNTIEAHMTNLRKKLIKNNDVGNDTGDNTINNTVNNTEEVIKNIPGRGYIID